MGLFETEIDNRNLMALWLEGLGLEGAGYRAQRIYNYKEAEYNALIALGWGHIRAIEETLGITPRHRGDQTKATEGIKIALEGLEK